MPFITKIAHIKNFGSFKDWSWDEKKLPEFNKKNLFYGWNGSGKTFLSRIFRDFEQEKSILDAPAEQENRDDFTYDSANPRDVSVQIELKGDKSWSLGHDTGKDIRVFNKEFVERNFTLENSEAQGFVLAMGQEANELNDKRKELEKERDTINDELEKEKENHDRKEKDYDEFRQREAKRIKESVYGKGGLQFNINHFQKYEKDLRENPIQVAEKGPEDALDLIRRLHNKDYKRMTIDTAIPIPQELLEIEEKVSGILKKKISLSTGDPSLEKIKTKTESKPELFKWIQEGFHIHKEEHQTGRCLFCDNKLPPSTLEDYEKFFNKELEKLQKEIKSCINSIKQIRIISHYDEFPSIESFINIEEGAEKSKALEEAYSFIRAQTVPNEHSVHKKSSYVHQIKEQAKRLLQEKEKNLTKTEWQDFIYPNDIDLDQFKVKIEQAKETVDTQINGYNLYIDRQEKELKKEIECYIKQSVMDFINGTKDKATELENCTNTIEKKKQQQEKNKKKLEENQQAIRNSEGVAADEVTKKWQEITNNPVLCLEESEENQEHKKLKIKRGEIPATYLSEGEKTSLYFAYFLTKMEREPEPCIVFIDDPISSLDINHSYQVVRFLKDLWSDHREKKGRVVNQFFIATHNFEFFCSIREWFSDEKKENKNASFYFVTKEAAGPKELVSVIEPLPESLSKYGSEYQYLFDFIKKYCEKDKNGDFETYQLPNVMRRFLEKYLSYRHPHKENKKLNEKMNSLIDDAGKRELILKYLNCHSHGNMLENLPHACNESNLKNIVKTIMDAIRTKDESYYTELEKSVSPVEDSQENDDRPL